MGTLGANTYPLGQPGGAETVTLDVQQLPAHSHTPAANSAGASATPGGNVWATSAAKQFIEPASLGAVMAANSMTQSGGGQAHDNIIPCLAINFIIAYEGIFPTQA